MGCEAKGNPFTLCPLSPRIDQYNMALYSLISFERSKWFDNFSYVLKKMTPNVHEQSIKIQASKCCVHTLKSSMVWINTSLDQQQMDSKAIFPEQLKKGIQDKTYLPKQVFNAYKFVLFWRKMLFRRLIYYSSKNILNSIFITFFTAPYFYKWQSHLSSYFF